MKQLSEFQLDILKEQINIGVGRAADSLNQMLERSIELSIPEIEIIEVEALVNKEDSSDELSSISLNFNGSVNGTASVVFSEESGANLVSLLVPESEIHQEELNETTESTLTEVGNIVVNAVMGALSNSNNLMINYLPPRYQKSEIANIIKDPSAQPREGEIAIIGQTNFKVQGNEIVGKILIMFLFDDLLNLLKAWEDQLTS